MNKWIVFILGMVAGLVLAMVIGSYINMTSVNASKGEETEPEQSEQMDGVTMFEEPGDIIEGKSFKVFQVISSDAALVFGKGKYDYYNGMVYLLVNKEGKYYYDDQIINVPTVDVVRQIGIYQYPTKNDSYKTVPIIEMVHK